MAKFKVGDKVRVKGLEWWEAQPKNAFGNVCPNDMSFVKKMCVYCGKTTTITEVFKGDDTTYYRIEIDRNKWLWDEEFLESPSFFTNLVNAIHKVVEDNKQGITLEEKDGSIIITPIEEKEEDLPIDTPVMCSFSMKGESAWFVRFYAGNRKTWRDLGKSDTETRKVDWKCIIPFDKFNPSDIQKSLKHNIVK